MKCLVTEAKEKCKCKWCKVFREMEEISLKQIIENQLRTTEYKTLIEARLLNEGEENKK